MCLENHCIVLNSLIFWTTCVGWLSRNESILLSPALFFRKCVLECTVLETNPLVMSQRVLLPLPGLVTGFPIWDHFVSYSLPNVWKAQEIISLSRKAKGQAKPFSANIKLNPLFSGDIVRFFLIVQSCSAGTGGIWETLKPHENCLWMENKHNVRQRRSCKKKVFFFQHSKSHFDCSLISRNSPAWSGVAQTRSSKGVERFWLSLCTLLEHRTSRHLCTATQGICCMRHCRQNQTERKWQLCDSPSPSANSISIFICGALNHIQEASRINQSEEEAADPSRVSVKRLRLGKAAWKTVRMQMLINTTEIFIASVSCQCFSCTDSQVIQGANSLRSDWLICSYK